VVPVVAGRALSYRVWERGKKHRQHYDSHSLDLQHTVVLSQHSDPNSSDQDASKKTEGLELGAVDKLLVGIFVGCDGEEEETYPSLFPDHPIYFCIVYQ
jgi:hypothetical protein